MRNKLVSDETLEAYKARYEKMQKQLDTDEGDRLFVSKVTAVSEQIDNIHVKASVGDYVIENDGPKDLGGSDNIPGPMQMLLASLANCLEITALLYLSSSNVKVNSIKVEVEAIYDKRSSINPKKEPFPGYYDIKYICSPSSFKKCEKANKKTVLHLDSNRWYEIFLKSERK